MRAGASKLVGLVTGSQRSSGSLANELVIVYFTQLQKAV